MKENEESRSGEGTQYGITKSQSKTGKDSNQKSQLQKKTELPQKTSISNISKLLNSKTGVWSSFGHFF